jgi:endonuclease-3
MPQNSNPTSEKMNKKHVKQILNLLTAEYGNRQWQLDPDPIAVLVQTILSQNTSDRNSHRAFESLRYSFRKWQDITDAGIDNIAASIRAGGLGEIKARYIKQALENIKRRQGKLELDFLKQFTIDGARDWLTRLPGVGMKTASCVLLFSLGMPALPVDTHISRVARRLGLIDNKISIDKAHKVLENIIPKNYVYSFHVLIIEHGRKTCKAQRPHCSRCVLQKICPFLEELSKLNESEV